MVTYYICQFCGSEGKGQLWCECNDKHDKILKTEIERSKILKIRFKEYFIIIETIKNIYRINTNENIYCKIEKINNYMKKEK